MILGLFTVLSRTPAIRASILHMLPAFLRSAELSPDWAFRAAGLEPDVSASDAIVHRAQVCAALEAAARALGHPTLGLSLGERADPAQLGAAGRSLLVGATLGECLRTHIAAMPALQTHVDLSVTLRNGEAVWRHRLLDESHPGAWLLYEGASAFTLAGLRALLGQTWSPSRVSFPHACRGRVAAYEAHFGAPVLFGCDDEARIHFDARLLQRPVLRQPPSFVATADSRDAIAAFRMDPDGIEAAVLRIIEAGLPHDAASLAGAARSLGLAPRTLQRRLLARGLTFESLLERARWRAAVERLRGGQAPVGEIAQALGYSDAAHFIRAFQRWTGTTPGAFRRAG